MNQSINKILKKTQKKKYSTGYLELIIGPMYSGKTSKLIEIAKQCNLCDISYVVINHKLDDRFNNVTVNDSMMYTHDKVNIKCIYVDKIKTIMETINNFDVILINEGQFFTDLYESVEEMLLINKQVYIAGLDGDFQRKRFGSIIDLIPVCDKVTKLNSLCGVCRDGTPGIFSLRTFQEKEQIVIGSNNYIPVCRNCYLLFNENNS
jgi:thymidine kinase